MKSALLGRESPLPLLLPFSSVVVVIPPHTHNPYPKPTSTINDDDQHFVTQSKQSKNQETTTLSSLFSSCLCLQSDCNEPENVPRE